MCQDSASETIGCEVIDPMQSMTHSNPQLNNLLTRLEAGGRRITPQRTLVIQALVAHGGHPTPIEVRDLVWQGDTSISQATVYNTLVILEELGLISKLEIVGDEHAHYDLDVHAHVNVVCTHCRSIVDVHTDSLEALLGLIATRSGYQLVPDEGVIVYGTCAACQSAAASEIPPSS